MHSEELSYFALHSGLRKKDFVAPLRSKTNQRQRSVLEVSFAAHCFPNTTTIKKLAFQTGLSKEKLYHWFRNQRHNKRKHDGRLCKSHLQLYENYICKYVTCQ